jgi:hypothetical protein
MEEHSMRQMVALVSMIGCLTGHAAASQARGAAATGERISACTLLSRDLVQKFNTGNNEVLKFMKPSEEPIGANGSYCEDGSIGFQINPFARADELRKSPGEDWQRLTGVGDTAFFRNKADTYAELMVWTGPHHFTLQLGVPMGGTVESIKPKTIELARAIIAKLR